MKHENAVLWGAWNEIDKWMKWTNSIMYVTRGKLNGIREGFANFSAWLVQLNKRGLFVEPFDVLWLWINVKIRIFIQGNLESSKSRSALAQTQLKFFQRYLNVLFRLKRVNEGIMKKLRQKTSSWMWHWCLKVVKCFWLSRLGAKNSEDFKSTCE